MANFVQIARSISRKMHFDEIIVKYMAQNVYSNLSDDTRPCGSPCLDKDCRFMQGNNLFKLSVIVGANTIVCVCFH